MKPRPRPVSLVILDGWGLSEHSSGPPTVTMEAQTPNFRRLLADYPHTKLDASGEAVGLMPGQMGDSNVGHLNIGAGRIVYQDVVRISKEMRKGAFFKNPAFLGAVRNAKEKGSSLHFMGLLSDGGVHSLETHLFALIDVCKSQGLSKVFVHAFLDGRDVPPRSAATYFELLGAKLAEAGTGRIATMQGRFYVMDRDKRWDRVEKAYRLLTRGEGLAARDWREGLAQSYARDESDEFVRPTRIGSAPQGGLPDVQGGFPKDGFSKDALIKDGDSIIFFNFRADRAREITHAFVDDEFTAFDRGHRPDVYYCGVIRYEEDLAGHYAYVPMTLDNTLGAVVSKAGLRQLRIAETEKYAHVTFFLNGKKDDPFPGEDRVLIPSPKEVPTYDLKPEMSAYRVTDAAVDRVRSQVYDLIVLNYANPDMVGHTGVYGAAVKALEAVDECLGRFLGAVLDGGGVALVVADHGNIEDLRRGDTRAHTYHSMNPVPCVLAGRDVSGVRLRAGGVLADVAPTVLELLGIPKPAEMDRQSLIERVE